MFKYVWIIILALAASMFIAYTIWAIFDSLYNHQNNYFIDAFLTYHDELAAIWLGILFFGGIALFACSIMAYLDSLG